MSTNDNETWGDYSKLVLKELERLNETYESMRTNIDSRLTEINNKLSDFRNTENTVKDHKLWVKEVNDVWSPNQMQAAKDELYAQKGKWTAAIAIFSFIQIIMGIIIALGLKLFK